MSLENLLAGAVIFGPVVYYALGRMFPRRPKGEG